MCMKTKLQKITQTVVKSVVELLEDEIYKIVLLLKSRETFESRRSVLSFYQNIEKEGVVLYGE